MHIYIHTYIHTHIIVIIPIISHYQCGRKAFITPSTSLILMWQMLQFRTSTCIFTCICTYMHTNINNRAEIHICTHSYIHTTHSSDYMKNMPVDIFGSECDRKGRLMSQYLLPLIRVIYCSDTVYSLLIGPIEFSGVKCNLMFR